METIKGVPEHVKVVAIDRPKYGEYFLDTLGNLEQAHRDYDVSRLPIIAPNNVYLTVDLTSVPVPAGYERAGKEQGEWYRRVNDKVDTWLAPNGTVHSDELCGGYTNCGDDIYEGDRMRIILRKSRTTKKVLVVECDMDDEFVGYPEVLATAGGTYKKALSVNTYRIETREVSA